jgi:predicted dinucleotide-binding enzyme
MRIAIIGVGTVGSGLARAAASLGHDVVLSARHPEHAAKVAEDVGARAADSAAEAADGAHMVVLAVPSTAVAGVSDKAFNTVFGGFLTHPVVDGIPLDGFYAGDDPAAKAAVADLVAAMGLRPIDVGALRAARSLEHMAFLNISLNARNGLSWSSGWKLLGDVGRAET